MIIRDTMGLCLTSNGEIRFFWRVLLALLVGRPLFTVLVPLISGGPDSDPLIDRLAADPRLSLLLPLLAALLYWLLGRVPGLRWQQPKLRQLGLGPEPVPWKEIILGASAGLASVSLVVLLIWSAGSATGFVFVWQALDGKTVVSLLNALPAYLIIPALEEFFFRAVFICFVLELAGPRAGLLLPAIFFGLGHAFNPQASLLPVINLMLMGLFTGGLFLRRRSLYGPLGWHLGWNFTLALVWGLPVSGYRHLPALLFRIEGLEAGWIGGGGFGPEASPVTTIVMMGLCLLILAGGRFDTFAGPGTNGRDSAPGGYDGIVEKPD